MKISEQEFKKFSEYIRSNFGISLSNKKVTFLTSRLGSLIEKSGFKTFSDYYNYVTNDKNGDSVIEMINKITTNYTYFFREEKHFEYLKNIVLPYVIDKEKNARDLRIWSAGCSSGEEPYTLQMIIKDVLKEQCSNWDTKLLATDISTKVLTKAQNGIYSNESVEKMPKHWQDKYFKKYDTDSVVVKDMIKNEIIYRRFNLMHPFPFKRKFHIIFCRNVMIYFNNETKNQLINKFYEFTEPGGYLFIGHSESIDRNHSKYKYLQPAIYRKE
ncbi:MAG: protein-glutamate O-methyltransferase CheR [Clostridia bacterium]|nr:protein-glutamate O-methyltransferase CheR [Clostridia bacterium]